MSKCHICLSDAVALLVDFGKQPLCNRYLGSAAELEQIFDFALGQCSSCGVIQFIKPIPAPELKARVDWITYNEQEGHLDDLVEKVSTLPGVSLSSAIGAISYKDDTTIARFAKRGHATTWRINLEQDLGIADRCAALETVQEQLTSDRARHVAEKYGRADVLIVRHILEHAHVPTQFAEALRALVNPNGYLVFEVPDCQPALTRGDYSMPWEEHIVYYTPESFQRSLALLGFSQVYYHCYPYSNENSLIGVVQAADGVRLSMSSASDQEKKLGARYAEAFVDYRDKVKSALAEYRQNKGKVAVFGAGHLSCFWINALGLANEVEFIVDDHPKKKGLFMPGSRLPVRASADLIQENIKLCLLTLSPESEVKVVRNNAAFVERGGTFATIFPGKPNSFPS